MDCDKKKLQLNLTGDSNTPQTLMGQFMEALNPQTNLDDLNINLEPFQGGLDCNVDEVSSFNFVQKYASKKKL